MRRLDLDTTGSTEPSYDKHLFERYTISVGWMVLKLEVKRCKCPDFGVGSLSKFWWEFSSQLLTSLNPELCFLKELSDVSLTKAVDPNENRNTTDRHIRHKHAKTAKNMHCTLESLIFLAADFGRSKTKTRTSPPLTPPGKQVRTPK